MKKLVVLLCVVALVAMGMVSALANGSIGGLTIVGEVEIIHDEEHPLSSWIEELLNNGWYFEIRDAQPDQYENKDLAAVVKAANSADESTTLGETLAALKYDEQRDPEDPINLNDYDFVTQFSELVLTNGTEVRFTGKDDEMTARATIKSDAMKGEDPAKLGDYEVMLANPNTGDIFTSAVEEEGFNADEGTFATEFTSTGAFTIVQK